MKEDKFIDNYHLALARLKEEYDKHGSLVIGVDFDGTINDFHKEGYTYEKCRQLVRELKRINCRIVIWTAYKDLDEVERLLKEWDVPFDSINEGGINLGYDSKKPFFSALLDDRAGLREVYGNLKRLVKYVDFKNIPQIQTITSPENYTPKGLSRLTDYYKIFLGGSIDMGKYDWQNEFESKLTEKLKKYPLLNNAKIVLFNPLRKQWDNSWEQSKDNKLFNEQVSWELNNLRDSDLALFNIEGDSKSPITLMELGMMLGSYNNVVVRCPKEFYRHGNVDITMGYFGREKFLVETMDELLDKVVDQINKYYDVKEIL